MPYDQHKKKNYSLCEPTSTDDVPVCPHGPTLLFVQTDSDGSVLEKFYACSACRDRKDCQFYQPYTKSVSAEKKKLRDEIYQAANEGNKDFKYFLDRVSPPVQYCEVCGVLLPNASCVGSKHSAHQRELDAKDLKFPSRWVLPKESNKTNAQFFFAPEVTELLLDTVKTHSFDGIVCIGAPSIHESLQQTGDESTVKSFLLDIDVRLRQYYKDFGHFNMFNHHFFELEEEDRFRKCFENIHKLLIVVDPPYGGLLQALQRTIKKITESVSIEVSTMLFFPYFNEPQVSEFMPRLQMSDYKVNYSNHSGYSGGLGGKQRGSPARIYTDIPLKQLHLPEKQGYRYCDICEKYSTTENSHCMKCKTCTTKDGPSYVHCDSCEKCVKPTWKHCLMCERCQLPDHKCVRAKLKNAVTPKVCEIGKLHSSKNRRPRKRNHPHPSTQMKQNVRRNKKQRK